MNQNKKNEEAFQVGNAIVLKNEVRHLDATMSKAPWIADVDDPGTPHQEWTGKFYVGDGKVWCTYVGSSVDVPNVNGIAQMRNLMPHLCTTIESLVKRLAVVERVAKEAIQEFDRASLAISAGHSRRQDVAQIADMCAALNGDGDGDV